MSNDDSDKKYGRGKAPGSVKRQWAKGKSGNPSGRPRKPVKTPPAATSWEAILAYGDQLVTLNDTGEQVTKYEFLLRREAGLASKGDPRALDNYIRRYQAAEVAKRAEVGELFARMMEIKVEGNRRLAAAEAKGKPLPDLFPHPDNIVLNPDDLGYWLFSAYFPEQEAPMVMLREMLRLYTYWLGESRKGLEGAPDPEVLADIEFFEKRVSDLASLNLDQPYLYIGMTPTTEMPSPSRPDTPRLRTASRQLLRSPVLRQNTKIAPMLKLIDNDRTWNLGREPFLDLSPKKRKSRSANQVSRDRRAA